MAAAGSYGGIRSTSFYTGTIEIDPDAPAPPKGPPKKKWRQETASIPGISQFHDFTFSSDPLEIRAWKFYGIGPGDSIPTRYWKGKGEKAVFHCTAEVSPPNAVKWTSTSHVYEAAAPTDAVDFNQDDISDEAIYDHLNDVRTAEPTEGEPEAEISEDTIFDCPEPGCTASFQKWGHLSNHLDTGQHKFARENINSFDFALRAFKANLEEHARPMIPFMKAMSENIVAEMPADQCCKNCKELKEGWAIKQSSTCRRLDEDQKTYLLEKYDEGETKGKKWDPKKLAEVMRKEKINGQPRFDPEQYLKWQQILSFFSRVTAQRRKSTLPQEPGPGATAVSEKCPANIGDPDRNDETGDCDREYMDDIDYIAPDDEVRQQLQDSSTDCFHS